MNLNQVMQHMTLRQMAEASRLWRQRVGADGPKFQTALSDGDFDAMAAMVAARLRLNGQPDATIDQALDLELDVGADDEGEANGGNSGVPPQLSPANGS